MSKSYEIANEQGDIVVRFKGEFVDRDALSRLLDFVELESIRTRSQLTEEETAQLADEIDRSIWERIKHKYSTQGRLGCASQSGPSCRAVPRRGCD